MVSSRQERIEQAKHDWQENRFEQVPEEKEFIPLPEDAFTANDNQLDEVQPL
ncbi:hypothetical protein [Nostoc sp.]|uniref:hypothetical protein n=1 Tax=Nostoc sp. TaxID=1180 RepID=UPI002FF71BDD